MEKETGSTDVIVESDCVVDEIKSEEEESGLTIVVNSVVSFDCVVVEIKSVDE